MLLRTVQGSKQNLAVTPTFSHRANLSTDSCFWAAQGSLVPSPQVNASNLGTNCTVYPRNGKTSAPVLQPLNTFSRTPSRLGSELYPLEVLEKPNVAVGGLHAECQVLPIRGKYRTAKELALPPAKQDAIFPI
jgi:hypothetical protein